MSMPGAGDPRAPIPSPYKLGDSLNTPIAIATGAARLSLQEEVVVGRAVLRWAWFPAPSLVFEFQCNEDPGDRFGEASLEIDDFNSQVEALVLRRELSSSGKGFEVTLSGLARVREEPPGPVQTLDFLVPNFPGFLENRLESVEGDGTHHSWLGGLTIRTDDWTLTLDQPPGGLIDDLKREGGYGLTHYGRLERPDGEAFSADSAIPRLSQFLSFVSGGHTPVLLPEGHDDTGSLTWRRWLTPIAKVSPAGEPSVFPPYLEFEDHREPDLTPILATFMSRWDEKPWKEFLQLGVEWYLLAKTNDSYDTRIILSQAGLELTAWHALVHEDRISPKGFKDLEARDLISLVLSDMGVATEIPSELGQLAKYAKEKDGARWESGPRAVTALRNALVHPASPTQRAFDIPEAVRVETGRLALWYLELAILYFLGYRDYYRNQLRMWQPERPPWV